MKKELKTAISSLHTLQMELERLFSENESLLHKVKLKDGAWADSGHWKYTKSLEELMSAKKSFTKIYENLPKERKNEKF